ncbi:MAG: EAL domain-containing protein [Steroidobacteraceae bacterium]|jgi:diguanylate cyclase (GGDEF)-like protein
MPSPDRPGTFESLKQLLYRAPIGLIQTSLDGDVETLNPMSAQLLLPLSRDGSLDNLFTVLERFAPEVRELVDAFRAPNGVICDAVRIQLDAGVVGNSSPQFLSISMLKLDEQHLMGMISDISQQVAREMQGYARRASDAARIDTLTQMPNRTAICEHIQNAMRREPTDGSCEFAVLFLNCDRFKQINDALGHAVGDEMLNLMADRLRSALRAQDGFVLGDAEHFMAARVGGDEFVVLVDHLRRPDDVHAVAQRLLDKLLKPYGIGAHQIHCGVSIGVVLRAQAVGDGDGVVQKASIAMVEAKRTGGGRYVIFEPHMQERAARRSGIEVDLRRALAERELFVVYQPIVRLRADNTREGAMHSAGVEALVRWRHPTRGLIPPLDFIGVAEECGLIGPVGDFVLSTACHQFVAWQRQLGSRAPQTLAVNLSRAQLFQPGLVDAVRHILDSSGMRSRQLQLEVTESLAAQDERVQRHLHDLKELRLTLSLDDFGTGYSSLASLHQLPIDTVKIDRSFVSQADTSYHHRVLIEATVRVATSLGMSTVAEGIETLAQANVVHKLGCEKGQGYYFSKPLSAADIVHWLADKEPSIG